VISRIHSTQAYTKNTFFIFQSVSSLKTCPVCRGKNPSREHLANHFLQELAECLEGETQCSKCDFRVANTSKASVKNQSKMLALHHVTDHGGAELDELLTDLPLVQVRNYNEIYFVLKQEFPTLFCSHTLPSWVLASKHLISLKILALKIVNHKLI